MNQEEKDKKKCMTYTVMLGMLLFGTANILTQDAQNKTNSAGNPFTHPYMQTSFMFIGELSVFSVYIVKRFMQNRELKNNPNAAPMSPGTVKAGEKQLKMNPSPFLLAIPAAFDFTASSLMFIALTMTPASVYQMMRGFVTVITAILSMIFLKKKQHRHHWTGLACIVAALAWVGYVAIALADDDDEDSDVNGSVALGIILLLISQFFAGSLFIVEEYFIGDYYLDPLKVVGTEGMWGFLYFLIVLPIGQAIKCSGPLCNYGYFENSSYAFLQMKEEPVLIVYTFGIMISIAFFNVCGVTTTKLASAAQRSTVDSSRTVLIWIGSVALGFEDFQWASIPGFILLVFGTLLYNEIVVLPCMGFDQNTKEAKEARNAGEKRNADYMGLSPHAVYSNQRNSRLLNKADDAHYDKVHEDDGDYQMNHSDMHGSKDGQAK